MVEKEALNRFSRNMTTDKQKRQMNGIIRVRKSRRCTGVFGELDGSADVSILIFLNSSVKFLILLFCMISMVEFMSPLNIWDKKLAEQICTNTAVASLTSRVKLHLILWSRIPRRFYC